MKVRATGKSHHEDVMATRRGQQWKQNQISNEANDLHFASTNLILKLLQRVNEEHIRLLGAQFSDACLNVAIAPTEENGEAAMDRVVTSLKLLYNVIGEELRSLDKRMLNGAG